MTTDIKELRKRGMLDPQSLTKEEWDTIHKAVTSVPRKDFYDDDPPPTTRKAHEQKKKKGSWW